MSATALEQTQDLDAENAPQSDDGAQGAKAKTPPKKNGGGAMFAQKTMNVLSVIGLGFLNPFIRLAMGENPKGALADLWKMIGVPVLAVLIFLAAWSAGAAQVKTSLGQIPGPAAVWEQFGALMDDHKAAREREAEFYERQDGRNAEFIANGEPERVREGAYTGPPTYIDQIFTSLRTVFFGFLIATLFAVPIGIFCGLSPTVNAAFNPLIQVFKPVSPLAWLPIVTMAVSALYVNASEAMPKSFLISAITVTLCSLWPTLINTALGVSSIDKDLLNVSKVLQLKPADKIFKLVIPSSLPLIFTGLRLSLGVGWMVLIAAEMLAQNPGLGKFVWDEFQNGSSTSLARIMAAVLTIGVIGFLLDRVMYTLQAMFSFSEKR
jgi:nitrate/nitrite transport system permease protein